MNVIVSNKYNAMLKTLDIEVSKSYEGEYDYNFIIDNLANFYYQRLILDITALKNYKDISNLQRLSISMDMDKVILLIDEETGNDNNFLSALVSMGIYNFATNKESILYLYNNPNSYRDVAHIHQLGMSVNQPTNSTPINAVINPEVNNGNNQPMPSAPSQPTIQYVDRVVTKVEEKIVKRETVIIGVKNMTKNAGATSLIYMMNKQLQSKHKTAIIEIGKSDFKYLKVPAASCSADKLAYELMKYNEKDIIFVDMNDYEDSNMMTEVLYLVEPSTIKLNTMVGTRYNALDILKGKKVVLNKSLLTNKDIMEFEYESKLKVFFNMPHLDDRMNNIVVDMLLNKLGFKIEVEKNKGLKGIFKL